MCVSVCVSGCMDVCIEQYSSNGFIGTAGHVGNRVCLCVRVYVGVCVCIDVCVQQYPPDGFIGTTRYAGRQGGMWGVSARGALDACLRCQTGSILSYERDI